MTSSEAHGEGRLISPDESSLRCILERATDRPIGRLEAIPLEGDASDRRYFRVRLRRVSPSVQDSYVVMVRDGSFSVVDDPFLEVRRYLEGIGLRVPSLIAADGAKGMVVLEDLGSSTLQTYLQTSGGRQRQLSLYREAIDLLLILQSRDKARDGSRCRAYEVAFDLERFMWEVDYTRRHWLEGLLGQSLTPSEAAVLSEQFRVISDQMLRQPQCLVHRDYHSRNLMVTERGLAILDFQDARLGPVTYDLASLLRDSYVQLEPDFLHSLLDYYLERAQNHLRLPWDRSELRRSFDVTSLQRNFKAIGTFAGQMMRFGNRRYLPYIRPTLAYLEATLAHYPEFQPLQELLARRTAGPWADELSRESEVLGGAEEGRKIGDETPGRA